MTTFYLSSSTSRDHQLLWREAVSRGWNVERIRGITVEARTDDDVAAYFEPLYAPTLCERLQIALAEPPVDWLTRLPSDVTRRRIDLTTAKQARLNTVPFFAKPPNDKSFQAVVLQHGSDLPVEIDNETPVLISEPVKFVSEYRCVVLKDEITAVSPYVCDGQLAAENDYECPEDERREAMRFAADVVSTDSGLPAGVVVDVGKLDNGDWAVVEANGVWGAGIYGCSPLACLDAIHAATSCS